MTRSGRGVWGRFVAGLVVGLVIGVLGCSVVLVDRLTPVPVAVPSAQPVVLPVTTMEQNVSTTVAVSVVENTPVVGVIHTSGIVTQVGVVIGDQLNDGQILARIDGHPVVVMVASQGLYRDLAYGDTGWDVQVLQTWLQSLGFFSGDPSPKFGPATLAAVKAWQTSIGEQVTGVFLVGSVVWVGDVAPVVGEVSLSGGESASPGDTLFTSSGTSASISVVEPPGGIKQEGDQVLAVADVFVPYVLGSGVVDDPVAVEQISAALGLSGQGVGRVRSLDPVTVKVLPASAIVTDAEGRTCVFEDATSPATAVAPVGGGLGGVTVGMDFPLSQVLANPTLVRSEVSCG